MGPEGVCDFSLTDHCSSNGTTMAVVGGEVDVTDRGWRFDVSGGRFAMRRKPDASRRSPP